MFQRRAEYLMYFQFFGSVILRPQFLRKNSFSFISPQIQKSLKSQTSTSFVPTSPSRSPDGRIDSDQASHEYLRVSGFEESALSKHTQRILENGGIQGDRQKKRSREPTNDGGYRNGQLRSRRTEELGFEGEPRVQISAVVPTTTTQPNCSSVAKRSIAKAKLTVMASLIKEDPYALLYSLLKASEDPEYIGSIRNTTITEILRSLDPQYFIEPYKPIYRDLHRNHIDFLRDQPLQAEGVFADYLSKYRAIVQKLVASRRKLGLQEYKLLLNVARSVGDGRSAAQIWKDMIKHRIEPDTISYNYYFEARCWANSHDVGERKKMRVFPWSMEKRLKANSASDFQRRYRVGPGGLKHEVTKMFAEMVSQGLVADAKTFGLLMTAYCREGDLEGVTAVLKSVWQIDVDVVMESDDNSRKPVDVLPDSPLFPTPDLLFTIAHIFGSNNKLAVAMRVVDHISCRFSIPIDNRTWEELLEWTYVLSSRRTKLGILRGQQTGQLPRSSVESLWNIMVSPPYEIKPKISMFDRVIRSFCGRHMLKPMLRNMVAGLELHHRSQHNYFKWRKRERLATAKENLYVSKVKALQYKRQLARLEEYRDFILISRWFRLLLSGRRWYTDEDRILKWERHELPAAIQLFWPYRPLGGISYSIATGDIHLEWNNTWKGKIGEEFGIREFLPEGDEASRKSLVRGVIHLRKDEIGSRRRRRRDATLKPMVLRTRRVRRWSRLLQGRISKARKMWPKFKRLLGLPSHKQKTKDE